MKKILIICIALLFSFMLVACDLTGESETTSSSFDATQSRSPVTDTVTTSGSTAHPSPTEPESVTTADTPVALDPTVKAFVILFLSLSTH